MTRFSRHPLVRARRAWHRWVRRYRYEICRRCGRPVGCVWRTDDESWRELTGWQNGEGVLCLGCFGVLADAAAWDLVIATVNR